MKIESYGIPFGDDSNFKFVPQGLLHFQLSIFNFQLYRDTQKASAHDDAEAVWMKLSCRTVFIGNRLLPWMVFSGRRSGNTGARLLCVRGFRAIKPHFMAPFQGEENGTLRNKTTAATLPWDCRGRFSADSQHPSAPISEAKE